MRKDILNNEYYISIPFWSILFLNFWVESIHQTNSLLEPTLFSIVLVAILYLPMTYLSRTLLLKAIKRKTYKWFALQFIVFSILTGFLLVMVLHLFHYLESRGVFPYSEYFDMEIFENPVYAVWEMVITGVLLNLYTCCLRFFLEYIKSQKAIVEYQLRTLQHQVTPHFMFNVLNHIHILMQADIELASSLLIKYSEILRYQLYNGDKESVTLEQDIQFLKDFIAIEEIRWEDKLTVGCTWEIENGQIEVPALLFITFIENAFKYVAKSDFENGYINIAFKQSGKNVQLTVENSKSLLPDTKNKSNGLGLNNIRERLNILYYGKHHLQITESKTTYRAQLSIDL